MKVVLTNHEKNFRNLMMLYFFIFLAGGYLFYRRGDEIVGDLITFGTWLGFAEFDAGKDKFWVILSVANMAAIAACCFIASLKVRETKHYAIPMLISKLTSSYLGIRHFVTAKPHPFHILIIMLVDFPLFAFAVFLYIKAIASESGVKPEKTKSKKQNKMSDNGLHAP